jgi:hypothetical protein
LFESGNAPGAVVVNAVKIHERASKRDGASLAEGMVSV